MICWLSARHNRVFLGLHFMIVKCEILRIVVKVYMKLLMYAYYY